jgi:phosphohistidine phosphatase SixA
MLPRPYVLVIVRHAEAELATAPTREADDVRPLTDRGRRQAEVLAPALRILGRCPDLILTSPLVRARQTAAIIRESLGSSAAGLEILDILRPGKCSVERLHKPLSDALDTIRNSSSDRRKMERPDSSTGGTPVPVIMLVGHQPDLGSLILDLIAPEHPDNTRPQAGSVGREFALRKGSAVVLNYRQHDPDGAPPLLEAVLQPRMARLLGGKIGG